MLVQFIIKLKVKYMQNFFFLFMPSVLIDFLDYEVWRD